MSATSVRAGATGSAKVSVSVRAVASARSSFVCASATPGSTSAAAKAARAASRSPPPPISRSMALLLLVPERVQLVRGEQDLPLIRELLHPAVVDVRDRHDALAALA